MAGVSASLKQGLNKIREISSDIYHKYVPVIEDSTDIAVFSTNILSMDVVRNEFISQLINRIVYTAVETKRFNNPLKVLEGDRIPLGSAGQEIYTNPAKARKYNGEDFAGLLVKYESDVKVQYLSINMDVQYPVTVNRQTLKKAFVSWTDLELFIESLTNSLYNGAYIDEYRYTKNIVASCYKDNKAQIEVINAIDSEDHAKEFVTKARQIFLNFATPSSKYNAWSKCGGSGNPILTWTEKQDVVFLIRNDILAYLDVNVLANAFNMDKTTLMGNIIPVDNFDVYNDEGQLVYDGSKIQGIMCDKAFFKIKTQDEFMDSFYNANNRTVQFYLNLIKMYNYSLFANGVIFATEMPDVPITSMTFGASAIELTEEGETEGLELTVTPVTGTTTVNFEIDDTDVATIEKVSDREVKVTAVGTGVAHLTATAGAVSTSIEVQVEIV